MAISHYADTEIASPSARNDRPIVYQEDFRHFKEEYRVISLSRNTFYCYKEAVDKGGVEALIKGARRKANPKNRVDEAILTVAHYNTERTHQGKMCNGPTLARWIHLTMTTHLDG